MLNVPGVAEFDLTSDTILGLLPEKGIKRILGEVLPDPGLAHGIPPAELYLRTGDPASFHARSLEFGGRELSPQQKGIGEMKPHIVWTLTDTFLFLPVLHQERSDRVSRISWTRRAAMKIRVTKKHH